MHVVYKITLTERIKNNQLPYFYIGSKSNCRFEDGKIIDNKNKPYFGSSNYKNYKKIIQSNIGSIIIDILYIGNNYKECLQKERFLHISENVVMSPEYFNMSLAMETTYSDPSYATMRHKTSLKICRVKKDHPDVINGLWEGVSSGFHWYNDGSISKTFKENSVPEGWTRGRILDMKGKRHPFYGKKMDKKAIDKIVATRKSKNSYVAWNKGLKNCQEITQKTREKMSLSGKGKRLGEQNPIYNKRWINNGVTNRLINKNESLEDGWKFGQLKKKKENTC